MTTFPLVVSYYTKNTFYQLEIQKLIESCEKWGVEHHIEGIDSFGSWELNCAYKPYFLYAKIQELRRPILWVDADAMFVQKPLVLEAFRADFAVRMNLEWQSDHPSMVMSGSVYVNATEGGGKILKLWAKECYEQLTDPHRTQEVWDQIALRDILLKNEHGSVICSLPPEYTCIADNVEDRKKILSPVIEHSQASRGLKKFINSSQA